MPERAMEETAAAVKRPARSPEPDPRTHVRAPGTVWDAGGAWVPPTPGAPSAVLSIQRAAGNQAAMRMLDARRPGHPLAGPVPAVQRSSDEDLDEDVQRAAVGLHEPSDEAIRSAAAEGVRTPSTTLPHLDRIQASFGRHSIAHVQAHVGPEATRASRAMNALAYASGDHVVFGATPDLRTAAHEAAHIVQQQAGVQLSGGVGREGDVYERHADAVADAVVAGRSAEALLQPLRGTKVKHHDARITPSAAGERFSQAGSSPTTNIAVIAGCHSRSSTTTPNHQQQSKKREAVQMMKYFFWDSAMEKAQELKEADVEAFVHQNAQNIKIISTARYSGKPQKPTIYIERQGGETPEQSRVRRETLEKIHGGPVSSGRPPNRALPNDDLFLSITSLNRHLYISETYRLLVDGFGLPETEQLGKMLQTYNKREFENIKKLINTLRADGVFTFSVALQGKPVIDRIRKTSNFAKAYIVIDAGSAKENQSLPLQESGQVGSSIYAEPASDTPTMKAELRISQNDSEVGLLQSIHNYLLGKVDFVAQLRRRQPRIYIRIVSNMGPCDGCKLRIKTFKNDFKAATGYGDEPDKLVIDIYYISAPKLGRDGTTQYGWVNDEQVIAGRRDGERMYRHKDV